MDPTIIALRAIERILGVFIGGFCVYLGYRLFLQFPAETNSEGKVILPGGISVYLTRVGPGAFFALFGVILIVSSFYFGLSIGDLRYSIPKREVRTLESTVTAEVAPAIVGYPAGSDLDVNMMESQLANDIKMINQVSDAFYLVVSDESTKQAVGDSLRRIKLSCIALVWREEWGDYGGFRYWIKGGQYEAERKRWEVPAGIYNRGREEP